MFGSFGKKIENKLKALAMRNYNGAMGRIFGSSTKWAYVQFMLMHNPIRFYREELKKCHEQQFKLYQFLEEQKNMKKKGKSSEERREISNRKKMLKEMLDKSYERASILRWNLECSKIKKYGFNYLL